MDETFLDYQHIEQDLEILETEIEGNRLKQEEKYLKSIRNDLPNPLDAWTNANSYIKCNDVVKCSSDLIEKYHSIFQERSLSQCQFKFDSFLEWDKGFYDLVLSFMLNDDKKIDNNIICRAVNLIHAFLDVFSIHINCIKTQQMWVFQMYPRIYNCIILHAWLSRKISDINTSKVISSSSTLSSSSSSSLSSSSFGRIDNDIELDVPICITIIAEEFFRKIVPFSVVFRGRVQLEAANEENRQLHYEPAKKKQKLDEIQQRQQHQGQKGQSIALESMFKGYPNVNDNMKKHAALVEYLTKVASFEKKNLLSFTKLYNGIHQQDIYNPFCEKK